MRTEDRPERDDRAAPVSRRAFVLGGTAAAGTALGGGFATAGPAGLGRVVAATEPYLDAVREAADGVASVRVRAAGEAEDPEILVSGRPEPGEYAVTDAVVDGLAALSTAGETWRTVLDPAAVRERWERDVPVEAWSESDRASVAEATGLDAVERPGAGAAALVRGTRAYQYATGHGGVGYYGVESDAITGTTGSGAVGAGAAEPIVRLGYVHSSAGSRSDDRTAAFLERYGEPVDAVRSFPDPALEE